MHTDFAGLTNRKNSFGRPKCKLSYNSKTISLDCEKVDWI